MSRLSPVNQARWARFRHNRRGYWSLWIFLLLFGLSLCSERMPMAAMCWRAFSMARGSQFCLA